MKIYILGVAGTFMAGIAVLAKELGHEVSGCDQAIYPPMSDLLQQAGIAVHSGYETAEIADDIDIVLVGNAMSRGNKIIEQLLDRGIAYQSGPQWLHEEILAKKWVLAVSGTHGKTTTSSMLAWILHSCGLQPGFLIGGRPGNFACSAQLGQSDFFVIEADEYDTAFFDKRAKFVHYHPKTLIINNLEFDHADIYPNLAAIQRQFHHLLRTVPSRGKVIYPADSQAIHEVLQMGLWSEAAALGIEWQYELVTADASSVAIFHKKQPVGQLDWSLWGEHNAKNALAAIAASHHVGVPIGEALSALSSFKSSARRMQEIAAVDGIKIYEDFAHHPTAIATTIAGLQSHYPQAKILCALELGSYTMRSGYHKETLAASLSAAEKVFMLQPKADVAWDFTTLMHFLGENAASYNSVDDLVLALANTAVSGDIILLMSNGAFGNIQQRLPARLASRNKPAELRVPLQ